MRWFLMMVRSTFTRRLSIYGIIAKITAYISFLSPETTNFLRKDDEMNSVLM
jgi:hypothetical protein